LVDPNCGIVQLAANEVRNNFGEELQIFGMVE
jgi:hypothetical protein